MSDRRVASGGTAASAGIPMRLADILFSQGFGTRRLCAGLIAGGHVRIAGAVCREPSAEFDTAGLTFEVDGTAWPFHRHALILLHKPAGYECSQKPKRHPGVYSLLPAPLRMRKVQAVGRLDVDTTGVLLFTDDGTLLHRWTSPKRHVEKVYEARCRLPVDEAQLARLRTGVLLDTDPVLAVAKVARSSDALGARSHGLQLVLTEGRHHQVKRMVAAVGNDVVRLHRSRFGAVGLPRELQTGEWTWLPGPVAVDGATADLAAGATAWDGISIACPQPAVRTAALFSSAAEAEEGKAL